MTEHKTHLTFEKETRYIRRFALCGNYIQTINETIPVDKNNILKIDCKDCLKLAEIINAKFYNNVWITIEIILEGRQGASRGGGTFLYELRTELEKQNIERLKKKIGLPND